jgi:hypothetical protein
MKNRIVQLLASVALVTGTLSIVSVAPASANTDNWGDNGSAACDIYNVGQELGTFCMQSVTGWIQIGEAASQAQQVSCSNINPGGSPGLSWATDGQAYVDDPTWGLTTPPQNPGGSGGNYGWNAADGADLTAEADDVYQGGTTEGNPYGYQMVAVTNWGGSGEWQAAIACLNTAGANAALADGNISAVSYRSPGAHAQFLASTSTKPYVGNLDSKTVTTTKDGSSALMVRNYSVQTGKIRTDSYVCPMGMVRSGYPTWTVQTFPADHKAPPRSKWSQVKVTPSKQGNNGVKVSLNLKKASYPTSVQVQVKCVKA